MIVRHTHRTPYGIHRFSVYDKSTYIQVLKKITISDRKVDIEAFAKLR